MINGEKSKIDYAWHSLDNDFLYSFFATAHAGLSDQESKNRLADYGYNRLPRIEKRRWYARFFSHINNSLIYILLASSVIAAILAHMVDSTVILLVISVNTIIGCIQEGRAEKVLEAIQTMVATHAPVLRNNKRITLNAENIVPGDIVLLEPDDIRLLHVRAFLVHTQSVFLMARWLFALAYYFYSLSNVKSDYENGLEWLMYKR